MVTNSEADMIEITVPENREAVRDSKDWSKELVYKGVLFFDAYIEAMRSASPIAGIGKTVTVTQWDEDAGVDHEDSITIDGQKFISATFQVMICLQWDLTCLQTKAFLLSCS
jgi:hypothetical protein